MVIHFVLLAFKKDLSSKQINYILKSMENLAKIIPEIKSFSAGINNSPEGLNKNFTHAFTMHFEDTKSRDLYLNNSDHKHIATTVVIPALQNGLKSVLVLDYEY